MGVNPIATSDLWDLRASPSALQEQAAAWRALRDAALGSRETVDAAARTVFDGDGWTGLTADSYDAHRSRVAGDLEEVAVQTGSVADALDYVAGVLSFNQELLVAEQARLAGIPVTRSGGGLTYHPADEAQAGLVNQALGNAREIRARVDDEIAVKAVVFASAQGALAAVEQAWRPRTIGMLNLNIGQGYQNSPGSNGGTDRSDLDEIARAIVNADVDVATLQEVFGSDVERLEQELRELTGDEWTIYFGEASEKVYWGDGVRPIGFHEPFGNAIAVRHGGEIASSEHTDTIKLDVYGSIAAGDGPPTGTTIPNQPPPEPIIEDGEGRSATEVRIDFR